ncbi:MAG: FAD-dependent oxidoreductase [Lentilitoribacter sp.]
MPLQTDILIVGGGLSGLFLAHQLEQRGIDYQLVEARSRFGGRIYSPATDDDQFNFDMGPAWFWPGQPRIAKLLNEMDIPFFDQAARGNLVFEDPSGYIRRDLDMATMEGAHRVEGGLERITNSLVSRLSQNRLHLSSHVNKIQLFSDAVHATREGDLTEIIAQRVVLCVPPRLIEQNITFSPTLPHQAVHQMQNCPTWMAAHAKFIAVYKNPFWRDMGLSGDAISHKGPMMELHDASPQGDDISIGPGAIFGFLGVPAEMRKTQTDSLIKACKDQLVSLYGERAADPIQVLYKDWSEDEHTATPMDANGPQSHPQYSPIVINEGDWQSHLFLSSTETARQFGGFLEGALEAVEETMRRAHL